MARNFSTIWNDLEDKYLVEKVLEYTAEGLVTKETFAKIAKEMRELSISDVEKTSSMCQNRWNNKYRTLYSGDFEKAKQIGKEIREKNLVSSITNNFKIEQPEIESKEPTQEQVQEVAIAIENVDTNNDITNQQALFVTTGRTKPVEEVVQAIKNKEVEENIVDFDIESMEQKIQSFVLDAQDFFTSFKQLLKRCKQLEYNIEQLETELKDVTEDRDRLIESNKMFANILEQARNLVNQ